MGYWDYINVGASVKPENRKYVEKIFDYIGYAKDYAYAEQGEDNSFTIPDVYRCQYSALDMASGHLEDDFDYFSSYDMLCLLNALFPGTNVIEHRSQGDNTSDLWITHNIVYNVQSMTCRISSSDGRTMLSDFVLEPPEEEYVLSLIECSKEDGNEELTALLENMSDRIDEGLIQYKNGHAVNIRSKIEEYLDDYKDYLNDGDYDEDYDIVDNPDGNGDDEGSSKSDASWDLLGRITKILGVSLTVDKVPEAEKALREWIEKENYSCGLDQDDDIVSMFQKMGFGYEVSIMEGSAYCVESEEFDCSELCVPLSGLLRVLAPFCFDSLFVVESENMSEPMAIWMYEDPEIAADGSVQFCRKTEIREATDEDYEEFDL